MTKLCMDKTKKTEKLLNTKQKYIFLAIWQVVHKRTRGVRYRTILSICFRKYFSLSIHYNLGVKTVDFAMAIRAGTR